MKIVNVDLKKVEIGKFFPKENSVELKIKFTDGTDKDVIRNVLIDDPEEAAEEIVVSLRKLEKSLNRSEEEGLIIDNLMNIVIKDEDVLIGKISSFLCRIRVEMEKINGKKDEKGYLDMIRSLKSLKLEF